MQTLSSQANIKHISHIQQLMVAQKNGLVRFYDLLSQQPIMSLSTGQVPLISADWCIRNPLKIGAVARDDWLIWDKSKSRWVVLMKYPFLGFFDFLKSQVMTGKGGYMTHITIFYLNKINRDVEIKIAERLRSMDKQGQ